MHDAAQTGPAGSMVKHTMTVAGHLEHVAVIHRAMLMTPSSARLMHPLEEQQSFRVRKRACVVVCGVVVWS